MLINIEQTGASELDLRLVGTDGSSPFVGSVKQSAITRLKNKAYNGTSEEWTTVLRAILLQDDDSAKSDVGHGLEAVATIDDQLHIVIRKNIGGITQRLGSLTLEQNDEVEISLFDWAAEAANASDGLRHRLETVQDLLDEQKAMAVRLNTEINELLNAKKEHEGHLIGKFSELLNAKKLKIRDQQRLLSTAKIEPTTAAQVRNARQIEDRHVAGASRTRKRKVKAAKEDDSDDDDDGFELSGKKADVDEEELREDLDQAETPEASDQDDQTDDEDEGAEAVTSQAPAVRSQTSLQGAGKRGKALAKEPERRVEVPEEAEMLHPPPRRELPFARSRGLVEKAVSSTGRRHVDEANSAASPHDEDEETDDEL